MKLPSYEQCLEKINSGEATALDQFIVDNEPAGLEQEKEFREGLQAVVDELEK